MHSIDDLITAFTRFGDGDSAAEVYYLAGMAHYQSSRFAQAREHFDRCLEVVGRDRPPSEFSRRVQLAIAELEAHGNGHFAEAIKQLNALLADANVGALASQIRLEKGFSLMQRGLLVSAEHEIAEGLSGIDESSAPALRARGLKYLGLV